MNYVIKIFILLMLPVAVFFSSCEEEEPLLIGKWQRFDDNSRGSIIEVVPVADGTKFQGKLIEVKGVLADLGFKESDVKWRNIVKESRSYYEAEDLLKAVTKTGDIAYIRYDGVYIEFLSPDIILVKGYAQIEEESGTHQKWKRVW